jgi:hypothetical protein
MPRLFSCSNRSVAALGRSRQGAQSSSLKPAGARATRGDVARKAGDHKTHPSSHDVRRRAPIECTVVTIAAFSSRLSEVQCSRPAGACGFPAQLSAPLDHNATVPKLRFGR